MSRQFEHPKRFSLVSYTFNKHSHQQRSTVKTNLRSQARRRIRACKQRNQNVGAKCILGACQNRLSEPGIGPGSGSCSFGLAFLDKNSFIGQDIPGFGHGSQAEGCLGFQKK